jgi:hypothetical protein
MFIGKLIGEADGYVVSREFEHEASAIQWAEGAGLKDFEDQTATGEVWNGANIVWARSNLQTQEQRERNRRREATRFLAKLNFSDKGRR